MFNYKPLVYFLSLGSTATGGTIFYSLASSKDPWTKFDWSYPQTKSGSNILPTEQYIKVNFRDKKEQVIKDYLEELSKDEKSTNKKIYLIDREGNYELLILEYQELISLIDNHFVNAEDINSSYISTTPIYFSDGKAKDGFEKLKDFVGEKIKHSEFKKKINFESLKDFFQPNFYNFLNIFQQH